MAVFPYLYDAKNTAAPAFNFLKEKSEHFSEIGMSALHNSHYVTLAFLLLSVFIWHRKQMKKNSLRF
jgi:hypothetical protein